MNYPEDVYRLLPGVLVPQKVYTPPHNQANAALYAPIRFSTTINGAQVPGVRLQDALRGLLNGLNDANSHPTLSVTNNRVALRILWPGYEGWHFSNAIDAGGQQHPRTLAHIANQVANRINDFYREQRAVVGTEPDWNLRDIPFESLYLVELRNVSAGSWQPVICRHV
ncbi:hypothetical protein PsYK624_090880 [Phanerochaete sordida]|uniref:Uncharacterized protein n=1 Tax=Phanerochaete sordida TaxID=48140 RepID=A0A9P3GFU6_9APHY|nr:hypothetical protein PsYK624_090880 [Phanerochaete sordida]